MMRFNLRSLLFLFAVANAQAAYANNILKHVELSGAGGVNWFNTDDTHLVVSPVEKDKVKIDNSSTDGAWKVGVGYELFEQALKDRPYLNRLLLELNVYQVSSTVEGDVWQYDLPQFNNYTFSAPITSTRLMLDLKPKLTTWNSMSPYLIVGAGATWNTASYKEKVDAGISPNGAQSLSDNTKTQLAWDLGAGLSYALTDRLSMTAEYVYAFLGEATPKDNAAIIEAPDFSIQTQTLLFGFSLTL